MGAVSVFKVGNYHDQPQRQLQKDFIEETPEVGRGSSRL